MNIWVKKWLWLWTWTVLSFFSLFLPIAHAITVTGTLYNNTRWTKSMSPVILSGDVTVNKGVTLTIDPSVEIRAANSDGQSGGVARSKVELIVKGTLNAIGSASKLIKFNGSRSSAGTWHGIRVLAGAKATIQYAQITYAVNNIENLGTTSISNSTIAYASSFGIHQKAGILTSIKNKIHRSNEYGMYLSGGKSQVTYTQVYRNTKYGIYATASRTGSSVFLDHNTVAYNGLYGIYTHRSNTRIPFTIQNNIIVKNYVRSTSGYELYQAYYGATCKNNLIWDTNNRTKYTRRSPRCSGTVFYNPLFVNEAKDDYRIYDRSPARKSGIGGSDVGAYAWTTHKTNVLHGRLYTNLTLNSGVHSFPGDFVVAKGVTLKVAAGAKLQFGSGDDMYGGSNHRKAELVIEGKLLVEGTASNPVWIRYGAVTSGKSGSWYGIRVTSSASAILRRVKIFSAIHGIENTGTINISDFEIAYASSYAIYQREGSFTALRGKIHRSSEHGMYLSGGKSQVTYTQIYRNTKYGIYATASRTGSSIFLDHNTIAYNGLYGIYTHRSSVRIPFTIQNNIIVKNYVRSTSGYELYQAYYGATCKNNLIWDTNNRTKYTRRSPRCSGTVFYNPLFVNEAKDDYRIYDRSPARKSGIGGSDIGAYAWTTHKTNVLHGRLYTNLTLNSGIHSFPGDFVVAKGVTLKVAAGAKLQFGSGDDMYGGSNVKKAELVIEGKLLVEGTASNPVWMRYGAVTSGRSGSWYGIRVTSSASATLRRVKIFSAIHGIENTGTTNISDFEVAYASNYGIYQRGGSFTAVRGKIHRSSEYGMHLSGGQSRVTYTQIYRNTKYGIYATASRTGNSVFLDHNTVAYNGLYGIYTHRSSTRIPFTIQNNIIVKNYIRSTSGYELYQAYYGATCKKNLIWDTNSRTKYTRRSPYCSGIVSSNPLFVNEAKDDYHIRSTSPARRKGTDGSDLGALPFKPTLAQILITPSLGTIIVTKSLQFKAQGLDSSGGIQSGLTFVWKIVNGGGTISSSGLFKAGTKAGKFTSTVEVVSGSVKGYATVVVTPDSTAKVVIVPSPVKVQAAVVIQLKIKVIDKYNNVISGKKAFWSVTSLAGAISSTGSLKVGTKAGSYANAVKAKVDGITGSATVQIVANSLKSIAVSPNPGKIVANKTLQFVAEGKDAYGNKVLGVRFSWSIINGGGTIDPTGLLTAGTRNGTYKNTVQALSSGVKGFASLVVGASAPKVAKVILSPASKSLKPGESVRFQASAKDSNGKTVSGQSFAWTLVRGGGILSPGSGLHTRATFKAGKKPGSYDVFAKTAGVQGKATITIADPAAGKLAKIVISPSRANVKVKASAQFSAKGYDASGKIVAGFPTKWTVSGGGSINTKGLFTASTSTGTFIVTVTSGSIKASAKVLVSAGKAPTTPKLRSPANKSSVKSAKPTLEVANSTDQDGDKLSYEFEVASNSTFTNKVATGRAPESSAYTKWKVNKVLKEDALYHWRVRAFDGVLRSAWSSVWSFKINAVNGAPSAPKLSSPVDGGQIATLQPVLSVTNAVDPEKSVLVYTFEIASDKTMKKIVARSSKVKEGSSGSTSWKLTATLKDGSTYYWHCWAVDSQGKAGLKMTVASFSISLSNKPPSAPKPRKPKDGSTVTTLQPKFEVVNAIDPEGKAVTLKIEVDVKQTFDSKKKATKSKLAQSSSGITSWIISKKLEENKNYFWRVQASDGKATTAWVFGGEFTVNSKNDPPTAPQPKAPADGTTLSKTSVILEINNASDPDGDKLTYHFQISKSKTFKGSVQERKPVRSGKTTTSWEAIGLEKGKKHHWRARAHDGQIYGAWSKVSSFTIELAPEEKPPQEPVEEWIKEKVAVEPILDSGQTKEKTGEKAVTDAGKVTENDGSESGSGSSDKRDPRKPAATGCGCESISSRELFFPVFVVFFFFLGLLRRKRKTLGFID